MIYRLNKDEKLFTFANFHIIAFILLGFISDGLKYLRDREESSSDEDRDSVTFIVGGTFDETNPTPSLPSPVMQTSLVSSPSNSLIPVTSSVNTINALRQSLLASNQAQLVHQGASYER